MNEIKKTNITSPIKITKFALEYIKKKKIKRKERIREEAKRWRSDEDEEQEEVITVYQEGSIKKNTYLIWTKCFLH